MALDTLFFDLKINDLTDKQIESIKKKLSNLGVEMDISSLKKQLDSLSSKTNKVKIEADIKDAENSVKGLKKQLEGMSIPSIKIDNRDNDTIKLIKENLEVAWQKAIYLENELKGIYTSGKSFGGNDSLTEYVKKLSEELNTARNSITGYETALSQMQGMVGSVRFNDTPKDEFTQKKEAATLEERKRVWNQWASEQDKQDKLSLESSKIRAKQNAEYVKSQNMAAKQAETENNAMIRLRTAIEGAEIAIRKYQAASNSMGNTQAIENAIQKMREYINMAREASTTGSSSLSFMKGKNVSSDIGNLKSNISNELSLEKQQQKTQALSAANEKLANSHRDAINAANSHINANTRLGQSMTGLISIGGDLRNQLGMFISAYTFENLVKNVVQIGGEFEKQKLAMSSMLGSVEQADDIFNRMKNLALTSPFNFKDLSNYAKQLTAYGTSYKDLYDTTNRLADISAGLGGDMSRLVLAFSQVKAASFLRGQEMRQFTEFGVSLPDMLAKKYTEAEGKIVTAGDVIERVSKRMVSFQDVKDVLWQSTDKGGKFAGMQEVLAQSTSGMASNLKDAIDTAYYNIGNANSGVIKGTIRDLTSLVSHWQELSAVLTAGVGVYVTYRLAMAASNRMIGIGSSETLKGVMIAKEEEASILRRKAMYGQLTAEEQMRIANVKRLTFEDVRQLATSKAINADAVMRMVNSNKITAAQALQISSLVGLSANERKYLIDLNFLDIELAKTTGLMDRFTLSVQRATMVGANKLGAIGQGIGSIFGSIFTKANVAMAAAFIGLDAYMEYSQKMKQFDEDNRQTIKNAEDSEKNFRDFLRSNPIEPVIKKGNADDISKLIDSYKEQISSTPIDMSAFISNVDAITDAKDKLIALRDEMEAMRASEDTIAKTGNGFIQSIKENTSWVPNWISSLDQGLVNVAAWIGIIPQSLRNWEKSGDELGKSFTEVLSDVQKSTYDLETEMYKLSRNDIDVALEKLKEDFPELARQITVMRDAGASNNEVIKAMLEMARNNNITLFPNISMNTYDDYVSDYNAMMTKINEVVKDGVGRINANMDRVDVEGKTEKYRLTVIKSMNEMAKAENLTGNAYEAAMFETEKYISKTSVYIQDHPKVWKDMYDSIKEILHKNGIDIKDATEKQVNAAFDVYKTETEKTKPWLSDWLRKMNAYTAQNPIYLHTEFGRMGKDPTLTMTGPGKDLASKLTLQKWFNPSDFASMTDEEKQAKEFQDKDKELNDAWINAAKTKSKDAKELKKKWDDYRKDTAPYYDWNWDETHNKKGGLKKQKQETDSLLAMVKDRESSLGMVDTLFNKYLSSNYGESKSLDAVRKSGMSYSTILGADIKTRTQYLEWYYTQLDNLINKLSSNRTKLSAKQQEERKKAIDELKLKRSEASVVIQKEGFEEEVKAFKDHVDEMTKQWDNYTKLVESGMGKAEASKFIFGIDKSQLSKTEDLINDFYKNYKGKNKLDFTMSESEAATSLGGENSPTYKKFYNEWKLIKDLIENTRIQIQLDSNKAKEQIQDIATNIKSAIEKALNQSIGIGIGTGVQPKLGDYASQNKVTGLLELNTDTSSTLSPTDLEDIKNRITAVNEEVSNLKSSLLELLPAWDDIFGDTTYKSVSMIKKGIKEANDIIANSKVVTDKGKPSYFISTFIDEKGVEQSVTGTISQLDRLKKAVDGLGKKENEKNPFIGMIDSLGKYFKNLSDSNFWNKASKKAEKNGGTVTVTRDDKTETVTTKEAKSRSEEAKGKETENWNSFSDAMEKAINELQKYNQALTLFGSTIEALGGGTGFSDAAGVAGSALSGASSMAVFGPYGMAAGAAMGLITGIAELHDKALDRSIEKSKQKVEQLQLAYKTVEDAMKYALGDQSKSTTIENSETKKYKEALSVINTIRSKGNISLFDLTKLQAAYKVIANTSDAIKNYVKTGNAYQYQLDLYKEQLTEVQKQRQDEEDKKKTDQSKINSYDSQIEELQTKISQYWENLASEIYGIDLKQWASDFGDALYEAWQKGEDGATAFSDTAKNVVSDVVKKMLDLNVIEPLFKDMQTYMFGKNGVLTEGNLSPSGLSGIMGYIAKIKDSTDTAYTYLDQIDEAYKKKYGESLKSTSGTSSTNSLSGSTEQETNMLIAYMDSIRQDSYNNRMNLQLIVDKGLIVNSPLFESQMIQLRAISENTYRNAEAAEKLYDLINGNINGNGTKIHIA